MARSERHRSQTLYERLGVTPDAKPHEITTAYRQRALALHPDSANGPSDSDAVRDVISAYQVLRDPTRRHAYDETIADRHDAPPVPAPSECAVCRGTGTVRLACLTCQGAGRTVRPSPWLQTEHPCPTCHGTQHRLAPCGACAATGYQ